MNNTEDLIKQYLKQNLGSSDKTPFCLSDDILLGFLHNDLAEADIERAEKHICGCGFCLSQLNLLFEAQKKPKEEDTQVPDYLIKKAKGMVKDKEKIKKRRIKKVFYLIFAILSFILSFFIPRYFMQFLVLTLILGLAWVFESEGGRTLIMVLDSWRRHSHDDDDEISRRLKDRFKTPHK
ncbi:MAG: hypothetical protein JW867_07810 [Candidatus Omnitrophica bacterium]|nr:hypothetical protein [Candidatus Omnitrophota bacterium]